jgi:hypothetical protein
MRARHKLPMSPKGFGASSVDKPPGLSFGTNCNSIFLAVGKTRSLLGLIACGGGARNLRIMGHFFFGSGGLMPKIARPRLTQLGHLRMMRYFYS